MNGETAGRSFEQISTPEQARAVYRQANALYEAGDFVEAIVLYDKLVEADVSVTVAVNQFEVRKARAMAYCKVGRFDEAEQEFKRLLVILKSQSGSGAGSQVMYWLLVARHKGDEKKAMDEWLKL